MQYIGYYNQKSEDVNRQFKWAIKKKYNLI